MASSLCNVGLCSIGVVLLTGSTQVRAGFHAEGKAASPAGEKAVARPAPFLKLISRVDS